MTNTFKEMKTSRFRNSQHAGVVEQAGQVDVFKKKQRKRNVAISWSETQGTFCNMTFDLTNNQTYWVSQSEGPDWATYRKRLTINNNNQKWFHHMKTSPQTHTHHSPPWIVWRPASSPGCLWAPAELEPGWTPLRPPWTPSSAATTTIQHDYSEHTDIHR